MPARPPRRQRQAGDVLTDTCLRETPLGFGSRVRCPRDLLSMILQQRRHATAFLVISGYWHLRDATLVTLVVTSTSFSLPPP